MMGNYQVRFGGGRLEKCRKATRRPPTLRSGHEIIVALWLGQLPPLQKIGFDSSNICM